MVGSSLYSYPESSAPIVNGYFVVGTESECSVSFTFSNRSILKVFDDSGCPHTLEQLVIL